MKELAVIISVLLLICGCAAEGGERPADWAGPVMELSEDSIDFGECFSAQQQTVEVTYRNTGKSNLIIKDVQAECGCSKPELSHRELPPGATGTLRVAFLPPHPGKIRKRIVFYTNDDHQPRTTLMLLAVGLGPATLEPRVVELDGTIDATGRRFPLRLQLPASKTIRKLSFETSNPWISVEQKGNPRGHAAEFELIVSAPPEPMKIRELVQVIVTAHDEARGEHTFALPRGLQVIGEVRPECFATPRVVHLKPQRNGEERRALLRLSADAPPIVSLDAREVAGARLRRRGDHEAELVVEGQGAPGRIFGAVTLALEGGARIEVPVHGWLLK